ncbi:glycogen synthase GlgA [Candidatus Omnitrophota bacterium]
MSKKLPVAFLWHMHQPLYKDLTTGKYHLPWVRLHSTYSYLDMAAVLEEFPHVKCTFNITPSLIWQLLDISKNEKIDDIYLELSRKAPSDLTDKDKVFILKNFFSCDPERAILPMKRYARLYKKRGEDLREGVLLEISTGFTEQDFRDLQVLFNLAWCGFTLKRKDKLVRYLIYKGGYYTEEEKHMLLEKQKEVVSSILPLYKKLQDEGRIEITTTPFYHPILPLLCGSEGGYNFKEDAKVHIERACEIYEQVFGRAPRGFWPAEGSVSPEIIEPLEDAGIKWIATDEGILMESLSGEVSRREDLIYSAFTAKNDGRSIDIVFRDINLSNAISFKFSKMHPKKAAGELLKDLDGIWQALEGSERDHLVSIILDGENPWPYYSDGGRRFLRELYGHISSSRHLEAVTVGDFLSSAKDKREIENLYSGSWIDRNFRKWKGSPQKDKAWEYLERTRKDLFSWGTPTKEALEELYIAEGSDWFWWYDDFGTELNFVFDDLFRMHLRNVYKLMGREVPGDLIKPIHSGPKVQSLPEVSIGEMAQPPKILIASSEVFPFAKTGGLADVAGSLPKALAALGCDVRVIMPLYRSITDKDISLEKEKVNVKLPVKDRMHSFDIYSSKKGGVTTYFVRNKKYFSRAYLYGTSKGDYKDNAFRFSFFSKAVLGACKALDFKPDVIHLNDWQTALVPFYLKFALEEDNFYAGIKTLFTIHNMAYQGLFSKKIMKKIGIPDKFFNMNDLEFYGKLSFLKSGILYSDAVNTVSHRYAEEIMTSEFGGGLNGLLRTRKDSLYGIPNGVDYSVWSPSADKFIETKYDPDSMEKKLECKKDLIRETSLTADIETPIIGVVSRLAHQKGIDILASIMEDLVQLGVCAVILGRGNQRYNRIFKALSEKYPESVHVCQEFNDPLAHKIEAGADIFVMPSRYEPCGLNQMYSIKYGTIPVVRATGGLDDAIVDYDEERKRSNGFKFYPPTAEAFLSAIKRALEVYEDKNEWRALMKRAMKYDFSWRKSAEKYLSLYKKIT